MALLDVTEPLSDPDLVSAFTVLRRNQVLNEFGEGSYPEAPIPGVLGVVTANSPNAMDRRENYTMFSRSITVVTKFPLRGVTAALNSGELFQPDLIQWKGGRYIVSHVDLYDHFGPGFFQAECTAMDTVDPVIPTAGPSSALAFGYSKNGVYAPTILGC